MFGSSMTRAGIGALTLVVSISVAPTVQKVQAQTEADVLAPAVVTGVGKPVGQNQASASAPVEPPLTAATTNWGWTLMMESDDPRLSGTFETNQNASHYRSGVALRSGIGRLTNEGGTWVADFYGYTPSVGNAYVVYLTGEGAYEGLFAMLWMPASSGNHEFTGVIAPGPLPEPPDWVLPPEE